jgi:hypothetical protein
MGLSEALCAYRAEQALARHLPRYCIFGDAVIKEIVSRLPKSMRALFLVKGMGTERCAKYGEDILRMVRREPKVKLAGTVKAGKGDVVIPPARAVGGGGDGVYILELAEGRVYVGKSQDVRRRVAQHMAGAGSAFTKAYPPTGHLLPRLGDVRGGSDAAERDETLRYMFLRGIHNVRGWRYVQVALPDREFDDAEANIRELFDLCRRCGNGDHFIGRCSVVFDRLGRKIV